MKPNHLSDELIERLQGFLATVIGHANGDILYEATELFAWLQDELEEGAVQ